MQVKETKFNEWIKDLPINKRKFLIPDEIRKIFNLPEELRINIISPSLRDILPGNTILTEEMCTILGYPGLEGITIDEISRPFFTPIKHLPKDEKYARAYKICSEINFMRTEYEPEKSAIELVRQVSKNLFQRLTSKFIVPLFTDTHTMTLDAKYFLVQNHNRLLAVFKTKEQAEEYILMLRQILYMHNDMCMKSYPNILYWNYQVFDP